MDQRGSIRVSNNAFLRQLCLSPQCMHERLDRFTDGESKKNGGDKEKFCRVKTKPTKRVIVGCDAARTDNAIKEDMINM